MLIISGYFLYKNARNATEEALKMQAIGITVTLNSLIQNLNPNQLQTEGSIIMSQMLIDERWEGIAFLALYDIEGKVVLHSNPLLIGKQFKEIKNILSSPSPYYHRIVLGTGEEVFVSDTKINFLNKSHILRVALHPYPAEELLRTAKAHLIFISISAVLILLSGILAIFVVAKIEKMQNRMKELENLSMLSRVLAHEIRNPLGSIKGFAQYLRKLADSESLTESRSSSIKEYLDIIIKESLRLERLTNELSNYANPHNVMLTEFNLVELLKEVTMPFLNQGENQIIIEAENIEIKTDRDKLKQILTNIIQNSVDALAEADEKTIYIKAKSLNGKIEIEIKDTGTGMDEETQRQATEPFFTTKPKGTGLGLSIVTRLCEILKIEFRIKSEKGKGTTAWLIIPKSL